MYRTGARPLVAGVLFAAAAFVAPTRILAQSRSALAITTGPLLNTNNTFGGVVLSRDGTAFVGQTFTVPLTPPFSTDGLLPPRLDLIRYAYAAADGLRLDATFGVGVAEFGADGAVGRVLFRQDVQFSLDPGITANRLTSLPGRVDFTPGATYLAFFDARDAAPGSPGVLLKYASADAGDTYAGGGLYVRTAAGEVVRSGADLSFGASLIYDVVPEPSTWTLLGVGVLGVGVLAARRRRTAHRDAGRLRV
jgi:hypothetical protein